MVQFQLLDLDYNQNELEVSLCGNFHKLIKSDDSWKLDVESNRCAFISWRLHPPVAGDRSVALELGSE